MIYIANFGASISQAGINALDSFLALSASAAGEALIKDGSGNFANATISGSGAPGGSTSQLQYNAGAGAFGGISRATTDGTTTSFLANGILVKDQTDATKIAAFSAASITTGTTRTFTFPDLTGTFVLTTGSQTLQSKTLDNSNIITVRDDRFTLQDDSDTTKQAVFQLSGIATATTRTITLPNASGTLTLLGNTSTGSGSIVLATSPTLVTPVLGVATATSINGLAITTSTGTLTIANGKTLTVNNTLTFSGTDGTTMTFPTTSATLARTDAANTFTGASTASGWVLTSPTITTGITPTTNDGAAIGSTSNQFSDLFLAEGGVINWDNGDATITQSGNTITVAGADFVLADADPSSTLSAGFRAVPSNSQSAAYTAVITDSGKSIDHPSTDANARTFTIPANASVAFPIGTTISFSNMTSQVVTIAITTDTMYLAGTGTTGSRSLAQYGTATARKLTSTTWLISGVGLT